MFKDRADAGRRLAVALRAAAPVDPVVLALPRGGVPVAAEIARALSAPLDLVMVRKLGTPGQPELAMGAVAKSGSVTDVVVNREVVDLLGLTQQDLDAARAGELQVIAAREARYLAGRTRPALRDRTAIVVDDGIATGATMQAALRAVRRARPRRLILAVPVAPPDTLENLQAESDAVIVLERPGDMGAIGAYYRDFRQITDEEVTALLDERGGGPAR